MFTDTIYSNNIIFFVTKKIHLQMSSLLHVLYKRMTVKGVKANASYVPVVFVQGLGKNSNCSIALNLTLCYCYTFQTVSEGQTPGYHFGQEY